MSERCSWLKRLALLSGLTAASVAMGQQPAPLMDTNPYPDSGSAYPEYPPVYGPVDQGGAACGCCGPSCEPSSGCGLFSKFHRAACSDCGDGCDGGCCGAGGGVCEGCGGCAGCNCPTCSGLLSRMCLFCRGEGCYLCRGMVLGYPAGLLECLKPYSAGGIAAQRWYDLSASVTTLRRDAGTNRALFTDRIGGAPTFTTNDMDTRGAEPGMRLSVAIMFGVSGNLEATYMGLNEYEDTRAIAPGALTPFTLDLGGGNIVNYGIFDTATALSVEEASRFNTGEVNYRRRWVGPYGRFQGSWLVGIRYIDIDEHFIFGAVDAVANQSFVSITQVRNACTGAQFGGDFWWNVVPGVNLGVEWKGGLMGNTNEQDTRVGTFTNGIPDAGFPVFEEADDVQTTTMHELSATLVYRMSYSWTFRASYVYLSIDEIALATSNFNNTLNLANFNPANPGGLAAIDAFTGRTVGINSEDLYCVQGWTFGAEYLW